MIALDVHGVSVRFGGVAALEDVSIAVRGAELVGIIGPNGAGKTTLTNVLTGLVRPDAGEVRLDGERLDGLPPFRVARLGVGRTFQIPRPFRRLTVRENLLVPAAAARPGEPPAELEARVRRALAQVGLEGVAEARAGALSGGQQKLLELGRLVMLDPAVMILDEPFAGVHPDLADVVRGFIRGLNAEGKAFLVISHELETIFNLSRRLLVLAAGRLIADGEPAALRRDPAVIAAYLGPDGAPPATGAADA